MNERLPADEMVQPAQLTRRLKLLQEAKPLAWAVYESLRAINDPEVTFDPETPVLTDSLVKLCSIFDVAPVFFSASDEFIIDNPDILRLEV